MSNLELLVEPLKHHLGDVDTYSDDFLHGVLIDSVFLLSRRWNSKYFVDNEGVVRRNNYCYFGFDVPPMIQYSDHRPIVLMASIIIKSGKKFSEFSFIDVSYSNMVPSLQDDINELNALLPPKLAGARYSTLPPFEINDIG
jgi:hypothetical protein